MPLELIFLGHSAFKLSAGDAHVLIDPFLSGNPAAPHTAGLRADDIPATHVVLTHGHADHLGDTAAIAQRTDCVVHAPFELCNYLGEAHSLSKLEPTQPGGKVALAGTDGFAAYTQAFHSSSYEGTYLGPCCGVVVRLGGVTVYHAGDTALFSDMKLIGELYKPDVAILPAGDRFTMGPEHASLAADFVGAPVAIPCHFNTWPPIEVDISEFKPKKAEVKLIEPGASITVG
ncbi:MAG: metal-dependent hydrolase [Planctomycetota bacterium]